LNAVIITAIVCASVLAAIWLVVRSWKSAPVSREWAKSIERQLEGVRELKYELYEAGQQIERLSRDAATQRQVFETSLQSVAEERNRLSQLLSSVPRGMRSAL
jgi:uncharacterized protein involved in exopolysaccharide biosynthesis